MISFTTHGGEYNDNIIQHYAILANSNDIIL